MKHLIIILLFTACQVKDPAPVVAHHYDTLVVIIESRDSLKIDPNALIWYGTWETRPKELFANGKTCDTIRRWEVIFY